MSRMAVLLRGLFVQLRPHLQKLLQQHSPRHHPSTTRPINMINPFISNNEQLLFRKNYQVLTRPTSPSPSSLPHPNDHHLAQLQHKNPFNSVSPKLPLRNSSFTSPQRPNSLSRSNASTYKAQYIPRGGILQTADGWRKDIESRQRQKLHVYGVEGLRYNAYIPDDPLKDYRRVESHEYYQMSKPVEVKSPSSRGGNYDSYSNYYISPRDAPNKAEKPRRQVFEDEIYQSPNFNVIDPRKDSLMDMIGSKNSGKSSRHSGVDDMFESQFEERLKRSMQHGSLYGGGGHGSLYEGGLGANVEAQMVDSRHYRSKGSRFRESGHSPGLGRASMESSVHRLESTAFAPSTINFEGQVYHRILL